MSEDREQPRLLSIFRHVAGGLPGLRSFFTVFHLLPGAAVALQPESFGGRLFGSPPRA